MRAPRLPGQGQTFSRPGALNLAVPMRRRQALRLLLASPALACGPKPAEPGPPAQPEATLPPPEAEGIGVAPSDPFVGHLASLRERLPSQDFVAVVERPFVVIGEAEPEQVRAYAKEIVRWAVDRLRAAYFDRDPEHIIDIWLFEGAESYERNTLALFGERPGTPYGYYSGKDRALVMNIATGGGTLVHEIVHPFVDTNFPACPAWFNEGLASLYEQCADRDGKIVGLTNWRLAGLQDAIKDDDVPAFSTLCGSGDGFYTRDPGTNYAQARYLCYWLQEHGLLRPYFRAFSSAHAADPTGLQTLEHVIGREAHAFKKDWEAYVLGLRYPA